MARKLIVTENPEKTLWWRLSHFKNTDRVLPLIRSRHNSDKNAKKQARQIRYCIEQAEEYFLSAQAVTIATKPILLYYGMASLAWALVLFKKTGDYALDNLHHGHHGHGLQTPQLQYKDRTHSLREVLEALRSEVPEPITQNGQEPELRGTFGLLHSVVDHEPAGVKFVLDRGNGVVTTTTIPLLVSSSASTHNPIADSRLSLGQLLMQIPDMAYCFGEIDIRPPLAFCSEARIGKQEGQPSSRLSVAISRCTPEEIGQLRAWFPERPGSNIQETPDGLVYRATYQEGEEVRTPQLMETSDGRLYFYTLEEPEPIPELSAFLGAMFILGMLVRYYPHIWMHMLENRHPLAEVVDAFIPIAQRKFPNLILNNLSGDTFSFRHP